MGGQSKMTAHRGQPGEGAEPGLEPGRSQKTLVVLVGRQDISCLWLFQSLLFSFTHTGAAFALCWMMPSPAGLPALAGRPPRPREGAQGSGWRLFAPSPTLIPPASLHQGDHSVSSSFLVPQPRFASFSVFSIIPRNTFIFSMVLLRLATISSCTRREQGRTEALGTAFC